MTQEDTRPREVSEELRRHLEGREALAQAQRTRDSAVPTS